MSFQWENYKSTGLKHSSRWGHCSATLPNNHLVLFGGYVGTYFIFIVDRLKIFKRCLGF